MQNNNSINISKKDIEKQLEFLSLVHPFLNENTYHVECLEVRPISRTNSLNFNSLNLWRTDEKSIVYYENFFAKVNNKPICLYYSVFTLDYEKKCYKSNGVEYQKGNINNQNALYTQVLVMDFDNISEELYQKQKKILEDIGIETISIYSGHGYQDIILLKEKVYDKNILKTFTGLLLQKGFDVDSSIVDPARVMRLPFTYNCKSFDEKSKQYQNNPSPRRTYIKSTTTKRYNVKEVFEKLKNLNNKEICTQSLISANTNLININKENFIQTYPALKNYNIPSAVKRMLMSTKEGYRNKVLLFVVPFFRNYLQLDITTIKQILSIWANNCIPVLDVKFVRTEVERLLTYDYNNNLGTYDVLMKKEFGILETDILDKELYKKNSGRIVIPNEIFKLYPFLSDCSVKIYYLMKAQENLKKQNKWTTKELLQITKISAATFYRNITYLLKYSLVEKIEANKKSGQPAMYLLSSQPIISNYTIIDVGTIENMIFHQDKNLTDGEIKLYTYLYYSTGKNKETWQSQDTIGKAIGKKRNSVSEMTDNLDKKEYLKKEIYIGEDNKPHNRYIINYLSIPPSFSSIITVGNWETYEKRVDKWETRKTIVGNRETSKWEESIIEKKKKQ